MGFVRDGDDGTGGGVPSRDDLVALAGAGGLHVFFGIQHPDGRFDATDLIDGLLPRLGLPREIGVDEELWIARIHPDDRQRYLDELGWQALSRGTARSVYRFEIEGGEVDLEEQIVPVERLADGGIRCVGIVTDVSSSRGAYDRAVGLARRLRVLFWDVVIQPDGGFEPTYRTSVNDTLLGATDEKLMCKTVNPQTLALDDKGIRVRPEHIHEALRQFAGIDRHALPDI